MASWDNKFVKSYFFYQQYFFYMNSIFSYDFSYQ